MMTSRAVNLMLFFLVLLELASGLGSLLAGSPGGAWVFWIHRVGSLAILVLLVWKWGIVVRSYRKRGLTVGTGFSVLVSVVFLVSMASGVFWATVGFPGLRVPVLGRLTGLGVHTFIALLLVPLFLMHAVQRWPRLVRADIASRRTVLRYLGFGGVGLLLWRGQERTTRLADLSGINRRFTGSREADSFAGNAYPVTNWFTDNRQQIDVRRWQLRIHGKIRQSLELTYADVLNIAQERRSSVIDCTGGWYSDQYWTGLPVSRLLDKVELLSGVQSVLVTSQTGYRRRFALGEIEKMLLATHVGDEHLSASHGFPLRLIAPGYRGFEWVKWVVAIEFSGIPVWFQSPLPLQ